MPIAVVGIGCRFGGGIDSAESMWQVLVEGRDVVTEVPSHRWDIEAVYDPEPGVPGKTTSRWGAFIDDVAGFEPEFFGLTDREAELIDPQFRLLLETSCEALEHAGLAPHGVRGTKTAVMVGCSYEDYMDMMDFDRGMRSPDAAHGIIGTTRFTASSRIAYLLDLRGPAVTMDTACSSALVAVHLAAQALRSGEVDLALAGGVMLSLQAKNTLVFETMGVLSPHGRCRAFDAAGDGYVRGEGCGMVALKRLPDALEAGDRVRAVLAGSGINNNGRSDTMLSPSVQGQQALLEQVLARSGVDPSRVALIEAHGPGTPVGDPVEYASLQAAYGGQGVACALGSVKTNIGHCETASGIAGLIKAVLSVQHGQIPANLHFAEWNPEITPHGGRFYVPTKLTAWPHTGEPRLAAVCSYGMSGTNAHAIVAQAPASARQAVPVDAAEPGVRLYPLSAGSEQALAASAGRIARWLTGDGSGVELADVAHTLAHRREHRPTRAVVAAASRTELVGRLARLAAGEPDAQIWTGLAQRQGRGPVWVFSAQGSQWAGMGTALLAGEPAFARMVARVEPLVRAESGFSVTEAMTAPEMATGVARVQPTLFAMQVALAETWRAHGVEPAAVIGTSVGEVAAAVVAGGLSLADGVKVVCRRSRLVERIAGGGTMALVGLSVDEVEAALAAAGADEVCIAMISAPATTVIAGPVAPVAALVATWQEQDVMAARIAVDYASHSAQLDPILPDLRAALADLTPTRPHVPFFTTALGDPRTVPVFDAAYWADNIRRPVRLIPACAAALADGYRTFLEISPHPVQLRAVGENAAHAGREVTLLPTLTRGQADATGLMSQVALAHCAGVPMSWAEHADGHLADVPLPVWAKRPLWMPEDLQARDKDGPTGRSLLGVHVHLGDDGLGDQHVWQADVGTATYPWLSDHRVYDTPAMPGAGYAELALAAAAEVFGATTPYEVRELTFHCLLTLAEHTTVTTRATLRGADTAAVEITAGGDDGVLRLASAVVHRLDEALAPAPVDITDLLAGQQPADSTDPVYATGLRKGIHHGPSFAGMTAVHQPDAHPGTVVASVGLPPKVRAFPHTFGMHPVLADLCLQTMGAHPDILNAPSTYLPLSMGTVRRLGNPDHARWCRARIRTADEYGAQADMELLAEDGTILVMITDARIGTAAQESSRAKGRLLAIEWDQSPLPPHDRTASGRWLVCTEAPDDPLARELAGLLTTAGASCTVTAIAPADSVEDHQVAGYDHIILMCPPPTAAQTLESVDRARRHTRRLIHMVRALVDTATDKPPRLYVVTRGAQTVQGDTTVTLEQSALRGVCRVLGGEHPELRPTHLDLPAETCDADALAAELLAGTAEDEVAFRDGVRHVARLRHAPFRDTDCRTTEVTFGHDGLAPEPRTRGDLSSIELVTRPRREPAPGEIEIRVHAAGLNFVDVLNALGSLPADVELPPLGYDCAGVITSVGAGVSGLEVGDRVATFTPGALASFVMVAAAKAFALPDTITFEEAATLPTVYYTAWYALHHLARIQPGEHVLIHSATGGFGQAAIALAQAAGAVIHTTAGSQTKQDLLRAMGITHVYDSRTLDFAAQVRTATDGRGVDIVLNSLTGPALRAGLDLLRAGGRFIELGVRDIYADSKLGLAPFRRNITFASADMGFINTHLPDLQAGLAREVGAEVAAGRITPVPHTAYPLTDLPNVLRTMAAAAHTGKLVIVFPQHGTARALIPPEHVPVVRDRGAYVITGGLGGLGLLLAQHLAEHGAGRIVLNGRHQPSSYAADVIDELRHAGTDIDVVLGDIAIASTASRLIAAATATGLRVRGIAHAAAVVDDATITGIDDDLLTSVWAPKAVGAWHLDLACAEQPLDWWLGFSSAATLIGNPGQGAYAAANSWLDAFTIYRRSQGRTAHSIAWGAWAGHGQGPAWAERGGYTMISPAEGLAACQAILRHDRPKTGYLPTHDAHQLIGDRLHTTPFFEALATRNLTGDATAAEHSELRADLQAAVPADRQRLIIDFLLDRMAAILRRNRTTLDPDTPLTESGLDSLMALELRTHIDKALGITIPAKTIWELSTATALAEHLAGRFVPAETPTPAPA